MNRDGQREWTQRIKQGWGEKKATILENVEGQIRLRVI